MVREVRSHMRHGAAKKNKIKILKVLSYVPRLLAVTFSPSFQTRRLPGEGMCPSRVEGGLVPSFSAHTTCSTVAVFRVPPSRVLHRSPHPPLCLLRLTPRCRVREAAPKVGGGGDMGRVGVGRCMVEKRGAWGRERLQSRQKSGARRQGWG